MHTLPRPTIPPQKSIEQPLHCVTKSKGKKKELHGIHRDSLKNNLNTNFLPPIERSRNNQLSSLSVAYPDNVGMHDSYCALPSLGARDKLQRRCYTNTQNRSHIDSIRLNHIHAKVRKQFIKVNSLSRHLFISRDDI